MRAKHDVVDDEVLVTLEPRTQGNRSLEYPVFVDDTLGSLAATASRRLRWPCRPARLLHPARLAGLDVRTALEALQPGYLLALLDDRPAKICHPAHKVSHQSLQLGVPQLLNIPRRRHPKSESQFAPIGNPSSTPRFNRSHPQQQSNRPPFCSCYGFTVLPAPSE